MDELEVIARIAETLTTAGVLLAWVWAERKDVQQESRRVDRLIARITDTEPPQDESDN
jgi:hypothetical protein